MIATHDPGPSSPMVDAAEISWSMTGVQGIEVPADIVDLSAGADHKDFLIADQASRIASLESDVVTYRELCSEALAHLQAAYLQAGQYERRLRAVTRDRTALRMRRP